MLAIIGGTGLYHLEDLEILKEEVIDTPFGKPSAPLIYGKYNDQEIIFLSRHGTHHALLSHEINYRANIWALKSSGVRSIIGISAVGSLQEAIAPGDLVIATQYFDFVKGNREKTFFGDGLIAHVSTANPICYELANIIANIAEKQKIKIHIEKVYAGVDGPRLGTKVESHFLRNVVDCDVIGMTNIPEVFLAREAQICYCSIGIITDYDCWHEDAEKQVNAEMAIAQYKNSLDQIKNLLDELLQTPLIFNDCDCRKSLNNAVLSRAETLTPEKKQLLELLMI